MTEIRCNLHTHTTFCDGAHSPEKMVLSAIEKGGRTLGFSSHSTSGVKGDYGFLRTENIPAYKNEIERLKKKYADEIEILLGIEQDYFSPTTTDGYDYVIGSVHYIREGDRYIPIDVSYEELRRAIDEVYSSNAYALAKKYYETVADVVRVTNCNIVGHFDLLTKFNEKHGYIDENDRGYRHTALDALDALLDRDMIIEINTGAMSGGKRSSAYPADFIIKRVMERGGRLMLSSDCHHKENIFACFGETVDRVRSLGVKELTVFEKGRYISVPI